MMIDREDEAVRGALTRAIARLVRTPQEAEAVFRRHGLTGSFWDLH